MVRKLKSWYMFSPMSVIFIYFWTREQKQALCTRFFKNMYFFKKIIFQYLTPGYINIDHYLHEYQKNLSYLFLKTSKFEFLKFCGPRPQNFTKFTWARTYSSLFWFRYWNCPHLIKKVIGNECQQFVIVYSGGDKMSHFVSKIWPRENKLSQYVHELSQFGHARQNTKT